MKLLRVERMQVGEETECMRKIISIYTFFQVIEKEITISKLTEYLCILPKLAQLCLTLCDPWTVQSIEFSRPEYWSGQPFPSPGDLPNPGSELGSPNPGLPHCRQILYQLSHRGSPRTLEWVAYPFFSRSSQPRNQTGVSCIAGGFFTNRAIREALLKTYLCINKFIC